MKSIPVLFLRFLTGLALAAFLSACETGGGGGGSSTPDVGDNDINTVVCLGDSMTDGECVPAGPPYPSRLGGLTGKTVINAGVCGEKTAAGASRVGGLLSKYKPGYLCILEGANDAIFDRPTSDVVGYLRSMVQAAKANNTIPIIATLTPMYDGHAFANGSAQDISAGIRQMAGEEGVRLVDLEAEFGSDRSLVQDDGLHPSDSGTQLIALAFNDRI
ncbi:MAG: GDSL-type esterase/lipase family protein [bacterium]